MDGHYRVLLTVPSRGHCTVFLYFSKNILGIRQELDVNQINHDCKRFYLSKDYCNVLQNKELFK